LKSIALQIAENDHVFYKFVAPICTTPEKLITARHTWKALFLDFFNSPQYVSHSLFVVLDGVDEAPKGERETLFELLRDITVVCLVKCTDPIFKLLWLAAPSCGTMWELV